MKGDKKFVLIFICNEVFCDEINYEIGDGEVVCVICVKVDEIVDLIFKFFKECIDKLGVI